MLCKHPSRRIKNEPCWFSSTYRLDSEDTKSHPMCSWCGRILWEEEIEDG